jgi:hypothetical protein
MPKLPNRPRMDPRLAERVKRKKAQLDHYRPFPRDTVHCGSWRRPLATRWTILRWLARQGRLEAVKRGGRWYSTLEAIQQYRAQAQEGKKKRGRPPSRRAESPS